MKIIVPKSAILFVLLINIISCFPLKKVVRQDRLSFSNWKEYVFRKMLVERITFCENFPPSWGQCSPSKYDSLLISTINIDSNVVCLNRIKRKKAKMIVIHQFQEGFNFWYCETFLVETFNGWKGFKTCKYGITSDFNNDLVASNIETPTEYSVDEVQFWWNLKTGTFALEGIVIVTLLDSNFNILRCNLALSP